jgi:hypothetical protein
VTALLALNDSAAQVRGRELFQRLAGPTAQRGPALGRLELVSRIGKYMIVHPISCQIPVGSIL